MQSKRHDETKPNEKALQKPEKTDILKENTPEEIGGSGKPEPTRYGDWEVNGRCSDF